MCRLAIFAFVLCLALPAGASDLFKNKAGGADHPLVSRFKGSALINYGKINFERVEFAVGPDKKDSVEGAVFNYYYVAPKDIGSLEVFRSFKAALDQAGFKTIFVCDNEPVCYQQKLYEHAQLWTSKPATFVGGYSAVSYLGENSNYPPRFLVAQLSRGDAVSTVILTVQPASSTQKDNGVGSPYFLQVVEAKSMQTGQVTVSADALGKGLAAEGKVALYGIYFDTGKADIKPESKAQMDQLAALLGQRPALKVLIVGHTDSQGVQDSNLALSKRRAEAVVAGLVRDYKLDAKRLQPQGVAHFAPVSSNANEAGRAKNRRVEVVEQ